MACPCKCNSIKRVLHIRKNKLVVYVGMSKKDLSRKVANTKARIAELEPLVRKDPLKKHPEIHEELEKLKKSLSE